jgi:hypothetical protein
MQSRKLNRGEILLNRGNYSPITMLCEFWSQPLPTRVALRSRSTNMPDQPIEAPPRSVTSNHVWQELSQQITAHQKEDHSRSYLARVSNLFYSKDDKSLQSLEAMQADIDKHLRAGDTKYVVQNQKEIEKEIGDDKHNVHVKDNIAGISSTVLTVAPLLIPGPVGMAASVIMNGLDEANPDDSVGTQLEEFALGGIKGAVKKTVLGGIRGLDVPAPVRGILTGESIRAEQTLFDKHTYVNDKTGLPDARRMESKLYQNVVEPSINPLVIASDAIAFGGSNGLSQQVGRSAAEYLGSNTLATMAVRGATTGFVIGSVNEASREIRTGSKFSSVDVLESGAKLGGALSLGFMVGGIANQVPLYKLSVPYASADSISDEPDAARPSVDQPSVAGGASVFQSNFDQPNVAQPAGVWSNIEQSNAPAAQASAGEPEAAGQQGAFQFDVAPAPAH